MASQESTPPPPLKTQKGVEGTHWALTCRYLTGDGRVEEQESQDEGGKCIHVQGRQRCCRAPPGRKVCWQLLGLLALRFGLGSARLGCGLSARVR